MRGIKNIQILISFKKLLFKKPFHFSILSFLSKNGVPQTENGIIEFGLPMGISSNIDKVLSVKENENVKGLIEKNMAIFEEEQFCSENEERKSEFDKAMDKNKNFYKNIQDQYTDTSFNELKQISGYYFGKQGKLLRPAIINLITEEFTKVSEVDPKVYYRIKKKEISLKSEYWSQLIEIVHVASLIHDDIIGHHFYNEDKSTKRRGMDSVLYKFGKEKSLPATNFLIGRVSRRLYELDDIKFFQIYSKILENLTKGELLQATKNKDFSSLKQLLNENMLKNYYKTAALMSYGARGAAYIARPPEELQKQIFHFACNLGIAFQIIDDILDFTSQTLALGKEKFQDLKLGIINCPVLFSLMRSDGNSKTRIQEILKNGELNQEETEEVYNFILTMNGIEDSNLLAILFIKDAFQNLEFISNFYSGKLQFLGLKWVCTKVLTRNS